MSKSIRCVDQRMYFLTTVMVEKMCEDIAFPPAGVKERERSSDNSAPDLMKSKSNEKGSTC